MELVCLLVLLNNRDYEKNAFSLHIEVSLDWKYVDSTCCGLMYRNEIDFGIGS